MAKGGKNGSNTFGEGWGTFPPTFPPSKTPDLGGSGGRRPAAAPWTRSGRGGVREGKRGWGRRGRRGPRTLALSRQPAWRDNIVAPVHVARQGGPRHLRRGAALARAASVATLSRHMHWRDRGYLSRHAGWRDKANVLGPRRPPLPHPPFLSLTPPRLELVQGSPPAAAPPIPPNPAFWGEKSWGKRSPPFPEGIAPIFSSFNCAHL